MNVRVPDGPRTGALVAIGAGVATLFAIQLFQGGEPGTPEPPDPGPADLRRPWGIGPTAFQIP